MKQQREAELLAAESHRETAPAPAPLIEAHVREETPREESPRVEVPRAEAPRIDPKELLSSTGLQMVETDASKARQPVPEPERLGRPRREKPAVAAAETELVQVETRK